MSRGNEFVSKLSLDQISGGAHRVHLLLRRCRIYYHLKCPSNPLALPTGSALGQHDAFYRSCFTSIVRDLHMQIDFEFLEDELIRFEVERMARAPFKLLKQRRLVYLSASGSLWMVYVLNEGSHSNSSCPRPMWPHA